MFVCEMCGSPHDGSYGSGRFCSAKCARGYSTSKCREEVNLKVSKTLRSKYSNGIKPIKPKKPKSENTTNKVYHKKRDKIEQGKLLAKEIGLSSSPYSEYNVATIQKLVEGREAYHLCYYEDTKYIKGTVVLVHRYLMEKSLGRKLTKDEVVHHIDGNKFNNDISNLQVMSVSEHCKLHSKEIGCVNLSKRGDPWNKGKKGCYSPESLKKMSVSAKRRHNKNK